MFKIILAALLSCTSALAAQPSPSPSPSPSVQYVGLVAINPSQDAKALADWYQKFGVELQPYPDGGYYGPFQTATGTFYFAVHPKQDGAAPKSSGSVSVIFRVNDYNGSVSTLAKRGLDPSKVDSDATGHVAYYKDPDGNVMAIWGD